MIHKWIIRSFNFSVVLQKLTLLISSSASCCFGYFFSCDNTVLLVLLGLGKNPFDLKYLFWSHKHGLSCPKSGYLPKVSLKKNVYTVLNSGHWHGSLLTCIYLFLVFCHWNLYILWFCCSVLFFWVSLMSWGTDDVIHCTDNRLTEEMLLWFWAV